MLHWSCSTERSSLVTPHIADFALVTLTVIGVVCLLRAYYIVGRGKGWESGHDAGYKMGFEHGKETGKSDASEDYRQKLYALMLQSANAESLNRRKTIEESANKKEGER